MWPLFVVFDFPPVGGFPYLVQVAEQIQIKNFVSVRFIESFDVRILVRFTGLNVLNRHPVVFSPGEKLTAEKFWAIVGSQGLGQSTLQAQALKHSDQSFAGDRCIDFNMEQFTIEIIDHVKGAEPAACIERITHKVSRPDLIRLTWNLKRLFNPLRQSLLGPALLVQIQFAIHAIESLMVPAGSTPQIFAAFPEAPAGMLIEDRVDCIDNVCISILSHRGLVIGRPRQPNTAATALYGHAVLGNQIGDGFTLVGRP